MDGVFSGGDCVTGPSTAINAIAAGQVAAFNIDEYLGYHHKVNTDVEIPVADTAIKAVARIAVNLTILLFFFIMILLSLSRAIH